ncbi:MAG: bifunctional demethylmenaquinone methyltransferase/2-methoxy-6-polyprenyl-1,4-benzoquinol methylase UbiE [Candidatus Puniceispirillales bacterium]
MLNKDDQKIDFGYKTVKRSEKQKLVNNVFDSVASKYDLMNDLTSFGIHRVWKNDLINWLAPQNNQRLADIAGGTGDIARKFLDAGGGSAHVYDINQEMLNTGKNKNNISKKIKWTVASAENIPATEGAFERATIGFGLRNITDRVKCLKEIYRILKPGGRLICLEFSHVESDTIRRLYDTWSFNFMPSIGKQITGNKSAYNYLVESIRQFPTQPELAQMFSEVGFSRVKYRNLSNGIVALHSGWKL